MMMDSWKNFLQLQHNSQNMHKHLIEGSLASLFTFGNFGNQFGLTLKNGVLRFSWAERAKLLLSFCVSFSALKVGDPLKAAHFKLQQRMASNSTGFQFLANQLNSTIPASSAYSLKNNKGSLREEHPTGHWRWGRVMGSRARFGPSISFIIRYYMHSEAGEQWEGSSSEEGLSQEPQSEDRLEQPLDSEQRTQELRRSVGLLREYVASLPEGRLWAVPACVEEYCDRMDQYRLTEGDSIVGLAQRRFNKMLRNGKIKRNWNSEDLSLLVWVISQRIQEKYLTHFSEMQREDWEFVASLVSGSSWQRCKFRWLGLKKVRLVTHKWSKAESRLLSEAVAEHGKLNWKLVSQLLYERNPAKNKAFRTPKQCREHWNCFLNPNIHKGPWSPQEDRRLLEYVLELEGAKKWSQIAKFMAGRTENALKNRFNLLLGAQKKISGNLPEKRLVRLCLSRLMIEEGQQENFELNSPILAFSPEEPQQVQATENGSGTPIVPAVEMRPVQSNVGFQMCQENSIGFLSNFMIPTSVMGPSAYYISFVYPSQF